MQVHTTDDGLQIHRIVTPEDVEAHRAGFVRVYCDVFAAPPYEEAFTPDEVDAIWTRLTAAAPQITFVVLDADAVVAFASAIPLEADPPVARELTGLVPVRHTMYLAELGVLPAYRDRQLARLLVKLRLQSMDASRFTHVVLRAVEGKSEALAMYRELHFTAMGVSMTVTRRRTDGALRSDERQFWSRVLSQVHLEG